MPKSFYIIDGHAHIYRSYFAPFRDLTSPTGEPTKATFVFTQMLLNIVEQRKPDYLAMVIDVGDDSVFRKQLYPEYKANRTSPPDDFHPQEQRIIQIVRESGVPIFAKQGFEADDLIATMATQLCQQDFEVFLVSKDKDLRQILTPCVHMFDPQNNEVIDEAKLEAKVGYTPKQAVEVQTLMGDKIDNVPGIPGVGEMTAAKLVKKYGTADAVLNHLDELTPKMRENFEKFGDRLPLARQLVTLKKDVEFGFDAEACRFKGLNIEPTRTTLLSLGFSSLVLKLGGGPIVGTNAAAAAKPRPPVVAKPTFDGGLFGNAQDDTTVESGNINDPAVADAPPLTGPPASTCVDCTYTLVDTAEKFDAFLTELKAQKRFAFDTETDDLGALTSGLVGLSFSWKQGTGFYVAVKGPLGAPVVPIESALAALKPILEDAAVKKVGHNLKYDIQVVRQLGIRMQGVELDTMVAAFLLDAGKMQFGIDKLALDEFNYRKISTAEIIGKGKSAISMAVVDPARVATYASEDADIALRLADLYTERLNAIPALRKLADDLETPLIGVLIKMEEAGIAVDPAVLKAQSVVLGERIETLKARILESAGCEFNPDSPKQLGDVLFNKLGLKGSKKTKTGFSTDVEVLERLAYEHEVPKLILEYRSLVKLKNTYLDNLTEYLNPKTGRIHASFNQIGAATGRLSCNDPNLQNIPIRTDEGRRIRSAFVPGDAAKNMLLTADYSQIELRVLAHFTQEPALLRAFEADEDVHQTVASEVFGVPLADVSKEQRAQAKVVNFGIIYGISAFGLARRIDGLSNSAAQELINNYHKRFPSIKRFLEQCVMEAQSKGFVETILGRRRPIYEISSSIIAMRNAAERIAINSVVQGSAADLIKVAMLNIHRRIEKENRPSRMLLQVHDELVFETPIEAVEAEAQMVREEMTGAMTLKVPLKVEVGWAKNWQEVK